MAEVIAVVGKSGTGKSTSIEKLDPDKTYVIQVNDSKSLPFKGSKKKYSTERKNLLVSNDWSTIRQVIELVGENRPEITNIIIDDIGHVMVDESMKRIDEKGFTKFTDMAWHIYALINASGGLRDDLKVYHMWHQDTTITEGYDVDIKIKTLGKVMSNWFTPEEKYTYVFYSDVKVVDEKADYRFVTNNNGYFPAKTPRGCFDDLYIPNDLEFISSTITQYQNEE